jgi:hypothetical protein
VASDTVTFAAAPSSDEIVRLYKAGELAGELARYHGTENDEDDLFTQRCVALHNSGEIDLVTVPSQPAFAGITGHAFFTAQHLYCEAVPRLQTNATALMECCRILIEQAGADGAATLPNGAFRTWCRINPEEGAAVIRGARSGNVLARRFVTFALQAAEDIDSAIDFVQSYADDRRTSGMTALAGMTFTNVSPAQKAIAALEPLVAEGGDDYVRANALIAAFEVLKKQSDVETARRLIEAAVRNPGTQTLHGLAQIVWLHHTSLNDQELRTALLALEAVNSEHLGTVRILDMALRGLLATKSEGLALDFLTVKLRDGKLTVKNFETTAHGLMSGKPQRLYELIVRWFLSGSIELCSNVSDLVGVDKDRTFDTSAGPLGLTAVQQIFLCRKAIGFLFFKPVVCSSIIVSVLRAGDPDVEGPVIDLLFDPILLSYGGDAKEYLKRIWSPDSAYGPIQNALAKDKDYYAGLDATGTIKALHPSDHQRDVVRQRTHGEMRAAQRKAESQSVLLSVVHRSTILYGKRTLTYVMDHDGSQRAVAMDLKSFGMAFEWPRREILDPVGLDYMLRVYRLEKFK